ncbi:MAG: efflux RND transporter periplasmic adaptor subunit [Ectothiorhodospiraceae bacterium]|nr:efflux RND transporter periplasmic adaptor subunit [Ectothiorhodospiraceae bacterium]
MRCSLPIWRSTLGSLSLGVALSLSACADQEGANAAGPTNGPGATPIAALEVQPRDLSRSLNTSGTVEAGVRIRLASRTSGTVDQVHVDVGDQVNRGDILAELDVSEEQAELQRARAQATEARISYRRATELRERGVTSPADYQRALAQLQVADSEQALWQTRVNFGRVLAPRDATVTARHIEPGEAVHAQETVFELSAMDTLMIRLGVSELDVVHLETGQPVPVSLDALPGHPLEGRIRRIHPAADSASRLVTVEIALPGDAAELGVRPGYLGRVAMAVDRRPDTLAVPAAAIGEHPEGHYVYVVRLDHLERRMIVPGVTRGDWTEVLSGLERGAVILATNPIDMRDGQRVRIVGWRG